MTTTDDATTTDLQPIGAVVRAVKQDGTTVHRERFTKGDWWVEAWKRAGELRGTYPEHEVRVSHLYD